MQEQQPLSRRQFLTTGVPSCAGAALALGSSGAVILMAEAHGQEPPSPAPAPKPRDKGPRLNLDLVRDFVGAAHRDLEKVTVLLAQQPALLNAAWDWGGGDWETALGAAAHTGRRPIALFLLEKGARLDVFTAAMLGKVELVKAAVTLFPGTESVLGPHGIPLIAHARAGKAEAAEVVRYLESLKSAT